jgi:hypothetical protein
MGFVTKLIRKSYIFLTILIRQIISHENKQSFSLDIKL